MSYPRLSLPCRWKQTAYGVYDVDAAPKLTVSNSSSTPDDPDDTDEPDLPQTGQLNCPVSALALCGLVSFAGGWKLTFGTRKDQDEDSK